MSLSPEQLKGLDALANAVVAKAAADYRQAYMSYLKKNDTTELINLRRFFRSEWCMVLTDLDMEVLMQDIEKECKEKFERKKNRGKTQHQNQVPEGHSAH